MSTYKRGGVYWIDFQWHGQRIQRSARTASKRVAREFEGELKDELSRLDRGGKPRRTFDEAVKRFVADHFPNLKPKSQERYVTSLTMLAPHFIDSYLDAIGREAMSNYESARRKRGTSSPTIRRDLACLSSMMSCAVDWEWLEVNPVPSFLRARSRKKALRESEPRRRYLSDVEYEALMEHAGEYLKPMIAFAVHTGLRLQEQLSLMRSQISEERREILITDSKNDAPRVVPLDDVSLRISLQSIPYISTPWVFHKKNGERYFKLTRGLVGAAKRAGIKDLRWHDLRRTFGSWKLQAGVPLEIVSKLLGHKNITQTVRSYAFLNTKQLHDAVRGVPTKSTTGHPDSAPNVIGHYEETLVISGGSVGSGGRTRTADTRIMIPVL